MVKMKITEIITDDSLREMREHGRPDFPFEYYEDDFGLFDQQCIEWHWHKEFEIVSVDSGPVECLIGTERIHLYSGEGMFINSGVIHRYEADDKGKKPNILFAPDFFAARDLAVYRKYIDPVLKSGCKYIVFEGREKWERDILDQLKEIYQLACSDDNMRELRIQNQVASLWITLLEHTQNMYEVEKLGGNKLRQSRLQLMMQYIHNNYREKITLGRIADSASISESEALRCFHEGIQSTPISYLTQYRLNRAKELLVTTEDSITSIASNVGFESNSYFTSVFSRTFGITPKCYRKRELSCQIH